MDATTAGGLGGLGFVILAVLINLAYVRGRLPLPMSGGSIEEVTGALAAVGAALKVPSIAAPAAWLCTTVFAAGLTAAMWSDTQPMWLLVGFAGVLMQNVAFSCVEALRFGLAAAARAGQTPAGLWAAHNVLFGLNQVFLATALLGFGLAGADTGFLPVWLQWLGFVSGALLFVAASIAPFNADGTSRTALIGLVGWLGWVTWVVSVAVVLLGQ